MPSTHLSKRAYLSAVRDEQARATRRAIVDAAGRLFVAKGYAATTIDEIAAAAGVSRKTVFASGGGKLALLKDAYDWALVGDDEPVPMEQRSEVQEILATADPAEAVRLWTAMITGTAVRAAPVAGVLAAAAHVDAQAAELQQIADRNKLAGARAFVAHLESIGTLREGLTAPEAADLCWLAMDAGPYLRLVVERGWSPERYRSWLTAAMTRDLLGR
ncbi:TetR/AcrR family transcriptional regulator [Nakamurella sp. GG22]